MSQKKILTIVIALFIIVVGALIGGYFYLTNTRGVPDAETPNGFGGLTSPANIESPSTSTEPLVVTTDTNPSNPVPRLRKISATPVSGADIFQRKVGTTTKVIISFVDRGSGNLYETATDTLSVIRITNTTIPKVEEAFYGVDGKSAILRYTDDNDILQTFIGKVSATGTSLIGTFLKDEAHQTSLSPSKNKFFYIKETDQGSVWNTADFQGTITNISTSPLSGWVSKWPNESTVIVTNKPSSVAGSVSFALDVKTKTLKKLYGPKNGLVSLVSPNLGYLAYSEVRDGSLFFGILDLKTNTSKDIAKQTISDKCAWSLESTTLYCGVPQNIPNTTYPDAWYQGQVSFSDSLYSFDALSGSENMLANLGAEGGENMDVSDLKVSADKKYLIFTNKKDLSLWGLRIN